MSTFTRFSLLGIIFFSACAAHPQIYYPDGKKVAALDLESKLSRPPTSWTGELAITNLGSNHQMSSHLVWVRKGERLHIHAKHDATVMLVKGKGTLTLGSQKISMKPETVVSIRRGVAHAFTNESQDPAAAYVVFTPPFDGKDILEVHDLVQ